MSFGRKLVLSMIAVTIGTVMAMLALEFASRFYKGKLTDFSSVHRLPPNILTREALPVSYHEILGWVPRPNAVYDQGVVVSIDSQGLRRNGDHGPVSGPPVLAVGDSFTFGTEVSDDESWPAYLEKTINRPVLNGGVSAYGLDQIVLRAEQLTLQYQPKELVVAIVADDISRTQYAYRWAWRPYFTIQDSALSLQNVPVPKSPPPPASAPWLRNALGYSALADIVFRRTNPEWWLQGQGVIQVHRQQVEVSCLLLERLSGLGSDRNVPILFVLELAPGSTRHFARKVLACADEHGLHSLDLSAELEALIDKNRGTPNNFHRGSHLSPLGNKWVASKIEKALSELQRGM